MISAILATPSKVLNTYLDTTELILDSQLLLKMLNVVLYVTTLLGRLVDQTTRNGLSSHGKIGGDDNIRRNVMSSIQKKINHLEVLEQKHHALDKEIIRMHNSFASDAEVAALKIKKLQIKQEIEQIKSNFPK